MDIIHHYNCKNEWKGNLGQGTIGVSEYSRDHEIEISGKPLLNLTTGDEGRGNPSLHHPEDLMLASVSSCHMLSYLYLCSKARVIVTSYIDNAEGTMVEHDKGGGKFLSVTLRPKILVQTSKMIEKAMQLHHKAHEICYIASSVNFEIKIEPEISSEE